MTIVSRLSCAALVAAVMLATPALAKECKNETVSATSREYLSRSLGAFPGSWAAWRKEVKNRIGDGWQAWRRAEDRAIKCAQNDNKRWTCTRSARPCRPGDGDPIYNPRPELVPIDRVLSRNMRVRPADRAAVTGQIKTLQYLLNEAGFKVEIDGNFGRGTEAALRKFQEMSKISVDGRAGPKTVEALTS